jgi:hypothetical protein
MCYDRGIGIEKVSVWLVSLLYCRRKLLPSNKVTSLNESFPFYIFDLKINWQYIISLCDAIPSFVVNYFYYKFSATFLFALFSILCNGLFSIQYSIQCTMQIGKRRYVSNYVALYKAKVSLQQFFFVSFQLFLLYRFLCTAADKKKGKLILSGYSIVALSLDFYALSTFIFAIEKKTCSITTENLHFYRIANFRLHGIMGELTKLIFLHFFFFSAFSLDP